ncbi:hypothetical protein L7F22_021562 [Adiantum nelumboides]|nr:hypothetical protein [Adiantum nelumboides]
MPSNVTRCYVLPEVVSNGLLQGDIPTHFALPLLIIQITLVLALTRILAVLFKPLHQPRVLAEVIGGVLLGPTALGRNKAFLHTLFPRESLTILDTVSSVGLLFYMFLVGLELDLKEIRRSGKTAFIMAFSGIALPFIAGIGVSTILHRSLSLQANFAAFVTFMGVPIAITAFPVLARILAERKLFKTELGKVALPAAAMNDVCAWILLAIGVAVNGHSKSPAIPAYVLACAIGYVIFLLVIVKRGLEWIARRGSKEEDANEIFVCLAMMGVLVAGFTTDAIGIHPLFGAFAYGIMVPKEGKFVRLLVEKIEDFVTVLMLPLFFASSGLKTNLATINNLKSFGFLLLLVVTACVCKVSSTVTAAVSLKIDLRTAFAFGFIMNTKGLVELIVLNIGRDLGTCGKSYVWGHSHRKCGYGILQASEVSIPIYQQEHGVSFFQRKDGVIEYINLGLTRVNQRILQCAPCSVAIYVERGLWGSTGLSETSSSHKVAVFFFGGPDDREVLVFALRIAEHPNVRLFVIRFLYEEKNHTDCMIEMDRHGKDCVTEERRLDEESLAPINECKESLKIGDASYEELVYHDNPVNAAENMATSKDFSLVLIGRRCHESFLPSERKSMDKVSECSELGVVGDALVHGMGDLQASILVIQQYRPAFT